MQESALGTYLPSEQWVGRMLTMMVSHNHNTKFIIQKSTFLFANRLWMSSLSPHKHSDSSNAIDEFEFYMKCTPKVSGQCVLGIFTNHWFISNYLMSFCNDLIICGAVIIHNRLNVRNSNILIDAWKFRQSLNASCSTASLNFCQ